MFKYLFPSLISLLLTMAHFLRHDEMGWFSVYLILPFLLFFKRKYIHHIYNLMIWISSFFWVKTTILLVTSRMLDGGPVIRLSIIMCSVILFVLFSAFYHLRSIRNYKKFQGNYSFKSVVAFLVTTLSLVLLNTYLPFPIILVERFLPGFAILEIFLIGVYASFLVDKIIVEKDIKKWRSYIWFVFSIIFFGQLVLGGLVDLRFLQTGSLHFPIPAYIIAGPVYRGSGFFMITLFLSTIILIGPAWCSYLCYVGSWDLLFSKKKTSKQVSFFSHWYRIPMLIFVIIVAFILGNYFNNFNLVILVTSLFIILSFVMMFYSYKNGVMIHCTRFCPIGLFANLLGRINPVRLKIDSSCTSCNICTIYCKYDALRPIDILNRKAGLTCTLCGDCMEACSQKSINYMIGKYKINEAFLLILIYVHAVFLAIARI